MKLDLDTAVVAKTEKPAAPEGRAAMMKPAIVASVLGGDYSRLGEEVADLAEAGVDRIQWDAMDGRFVPNLTFGPDVIRSCRDLVAVPFEAHLMIEEPDRRLEDYLRAGCETLIVHAEACAHLHRTLAAARSLGARAGVALNPATPLSAVRHVLDQIDLLLVMTVEPGFGGQSYIPAMEEKIAEARRLVDRSERPIPIEVDGGINHSTIEAARRAGADWFVAGSAILAHPQGKRRAVSGLRNSLAEVEAEVFA